MTKAQIPLSVVGWGERVRVPDAGAAHFDAVLGRDRVVEVRELPPGRRGRGGEAVEHAPKQALPRRHELRLGPRVVLLGVRVRVNVRISGRIGVRVRELRLGPRVVPLPRQETSTNLRWKATP